MVVDSKSKKIQLSKKYPTIYGLPILEKVDCSIFEKKYFAPCMECNFCHDRCCAYGVDVDVQNYGRLLEEADKIEPFIGIPRSRWFKEDFQNDPEFPGGKFTRTQVIDGACVFLNRKGRGCLLHSYCLEKKIDFHTLKPMVGILFPVTFDNGLLQPSTEIQDGSLICNNASQMTLFRGIRDDLEYYFGNAFIRELDGIEHAMKEI